MSEALDMYLRVKSGQSRRPKSERPAWRDTKLWNVRFYKDGELVYESEAVWGKTERVQNRQ